MEQKIVIVGAGPAGVSIVEALRHFNRQARVVMLSAEPFPPYSPPALVDHFLTGSQAHFWRPADWAEQMGVDYRCGVTVMEVEPGSRQILLSDGTRLAYDQLALAPGSRLYAPIPGADLPGIYNFKSLRAAEDLVHQVRQGMARRALIVGAGFIGVEIAIFLRELGLEVIQLEMLDQIMPSMLDADTACLVLGILRERGIDVRLKTRASAFLGTDRAHAVRLESGEVWKADILVAATGVRPNLELIAGSGIEHGWGIRVDDFLSANIPGIYAAGDAVEAPDRLTGERYVHAIFPNAVEQGRLVGFSFAGYPIPYAGAERMNSLKHLGLPVVAAGLKQGDEILHVCQGSSVRKLYLADNRLVGYQLFGDIRPAGVLRSLVNSRRDVRAIKAALTDWNFGEGHLIGQAQALMV